MKTSLISLFSLALLTACTQASDPMVVTTESGQVRGIEQEGSLAFLGIPYAHVERFMPPQPVTPWDTIRLCDHFGPQAMQNVGDRQLTEDEMSEQCCVLNVWTTDLKSKKPVMLWLHGGGFDSGTSAWDPGMCLAHEDVVVVSVNHRLNILGFLDLSAADSVTYRHSGNVGMLDVVQALQWIHTNIARFGGDPTNVTVFGESGGGGKVGTLMSMPEAKELFHKAIIMSGTILNVNDKQMSESLGLAVLDQLNIPHDSISKINAVPYTELYAAGQRAMAASIGTRRPGTPMMWGFGPTPDGETLLQQPFQPGFASIADAKPILIGTTMNELMRLTYDQHNTLEQAREQLVPVFGDLTDEYISAFAEAYPDYTPDDLLCTDRLFRAKTLLTIDAIAQTRQAPTYVYMFDWRSPLNNGSIHGHELKFCFNTLHHAKHDLPEPTESDLQLASKMSRCWSAFAHTGNPNLSGEDGLPEWQPYMPQDGDIMYFGPECRIRHTEDRHLEEIINRCCFKQLDEFRARHSSL